MPSFFGTASRTYFTLRHLLAVILSVGLLAIAASEARAYKVNKANAPLGVYAHINLADAIQTHLASIAAPPPSACSKLPAGVQEEEVRSYLKSLYRDMLTDPAVSGITLGVHWCAIQVCDPGATSRRCQPYTATGGNDWSYVDDALKMAAEHKKDVQLFITPGFDTPRWVLDKIKSCDALFRPGSVQAVPGCGKVTFTSFPEQSHADGSELPLPWSYSYVSAWNRFLQDLHQETQNYPEAFAAIAIAGPVGGSTEMILPTTALGSYILQAGVATLADDMWNTLIANALAAGDIQSFKIAGVFANSAFYSQYPDQLFVDSWNATISQFERTFAGVTLLLTADSGIKDLPELGVVKEEQKVAEILGPDAYGIYHELLPMDCQTDPHNNQIPTSASCQAKVEVLSYFAAEHVSDSQPIPNLKATNVGGMTASSNIETGDIGVPGVKILAAWPSPLPLPPPPFLGGAEFDFAVTQGSTIQQMGCPSKDICSILPAEAGCPAQAACQILPEEAAYNVLTYFFNCTTAESDTSNRYFGFATTPSCALTTLPNETANENTAPVQFVAPTYLDIVYAHNFENNCPSKPVYLNGSLSCTSMQDLLNQASNALLSAAGQPARPWQPTCPFPLRTNCQSPIRPPPAPLGGQGPQ